MSDIAVSAEAVAGYEGAAERIMARSASKDNSGGGWEAGDDWNKVGLDLSTPLVGHSTGLRVRVVSMIRLCKMVRRSR